MLEKRIIGTDDSLPALTRYVYSNHLQSASLEMDGIGDIISYEEYHPYGTTAFQANNATINAVAKRYRYTGKERDEESGLYYHGTRYYIPWLARWTAIDSMESKYAGMSPYNYSFNNPVMFNDLNGADPNGPPIEGDEKKVVNLNYFPSETYSIDDPNVTLELAQATAGIAISAYEGVGNILLIGLEWFTTDKFEGTGVRNALEKQGYIIDPLISNEKLGETFTLRKEYRNVIAVPEEGVLGDLRDVLIGALDMAGLSPAKGTPLVFAIKAFSTANSISSVLRSLRISARTEEFSKLVDIGKGKPVNTLEAEGAALLEDAFGTLRSATKQEGGDFIFTSGRFANKTVDLVGAPR